ncbi:hypothetical protein BT96DRAFT_1008558 [Gymnopus androsaceus JB14]|uniref:Uncharacterized protein n=1 Tax=Gymnopus androsaceus JB14 TaxID=1447944 RepID=A0A6A4GEI0_9AGAR|nr:hypothetical protein BT96DRAFT_1008558 [Gymnopus androsaceus JB14]
MNIRIVDEQREAGFRLTTDADGQSSCTGCNTRRSDQRMGMGYGYGFGSTRPSFDNWHQPTTPNPRFGLILPHVIDASSSLKSDGSVRLSGPYSTHHSTPHLNPRTHLARHLTPFSGLD